MYNLLQIQLFQLNPFATRDWVKDECTVESGIYGSIVFSVIVGLNFCFSGLNNTIRNIGNCVPNWCARFSQIDSKNNISCLNKISKVISLLVDNVRSPHHQFMINRVSLIDGEAPAYAIRRKESIIKGKLSGVFNYIVNAHNRFGHNFSVKRNHFIGVPFPIFSNRFFFARSEQQNSENKKQLFHSQIINICNKCNDSDIKMSFRKDFLQTIPKNWYQNITINHAEKR